MNFLDALLLGILQGLTEFLPISSSGHLVLAKELLNINNVANIEFEVFVHFGTFISVIIVFWKDIKLIFKALFGALKNPLKINNHYRESENFRIIVFILIGTIPAGVIGIIYDKQIGVLFNDSKFVSVMLLVTGSILYLTKFAKPKEDKKVGFLPSVFIGIAQALAILPGISRSGITISVGLFSGISRENAAKFSFLLSLPVILGATILKMVEVINNNTSLEQYLIYLAGTISAAVSGYVAIKIVMNVLKQKKFSWFSFYCFIIGILGILFIG